MIDFVNRRGVGPYVDMFVPGLFYGRQNVRMEEMHRIAARTAVSALTAYAAAMRDRPEQDQVLVTFSNPVLFIAGEEDALLPLPQVVGESGIARFPVFHSLSATGHMGMIENEEASLKMVEDFMDFCLHFEANPRG